jgi:hypothetical protein
MATTFRELHMRYIPRMCLQGSCGAASRARGGSTEQVVAPESKGVIEVKVRSPASGQQVAGFPEVFPGKVVGVAEAKKRTKQETKKMTKSRRSITRLQVDLTVRSTFLY